ncbi:hypothetical protein LINPERHAP2_LOCUS14907, partial [Linum perenne]
DGLPLQVKKRGIDHIDAGLIVSGVRDQQTYNKCLLGCFYAEAFHNKSLPAGKQYLSAAPQQLIDKILKPDENQENEPITRMHKVWDWINRNPVVEEAKYQFSAMPNEKEKKFSNPEP